MLHTYLEVVNFLLQTYATNEMIAEAYNEFVMFLQNFAVTKQDYFDVP